MDNIEFLLAVFVASQLAMGGRHCITDKLG
jgi:hypothetical protein